MDKTEVLLLLSKLLHNAESYENTTDDGGYHNVLINHSALSKNIDQELPPIPLVYIVQHWKLGIKKQYVVNDKEIPIYTSVKIGDRIRVNGRDVPLSIDVYEEAYRFGRNSIGILD